MKTGVLFVGRAPVVRWALFLKVALNPEFQNRRHQHGNRWGKRVCRRALFRRITIRER